jgi:predicted metal-binding protein
VVESVSRAKNTREFDFLRTLALNLGATEAKIIPAGAVVVENRVVLKCRFGCDDYGKKLTCPPFTVKVDEFRKMLKDYKYALIVKFKSPAEADKNVSRSLLRSQYDSTMSRDLREKASKFWSNWKNDKKRILMSVLELEKAAFNKGYTFAVGFTSGSCGLCEKCNVEAGICLHPTMARCPEHAVGVNMKKTAENAGMPITFPIKGKPEPTALLLID